MELKTKIEHTFYTFTSTWVFTQEIHHLKFFKTPEIFAKKLAELIVITINYTERRIRTLTTFSHV